MKNDEAVGTDHIPLMVQKVFGKEEADFLCDLVINNKLNEQGCSTYRGINLMSHTFNVCFFYGKVNA